MSAMQAIPKSGYQLIGVAGMEYASEVEARGYNVITSQADTAIIDLTSSLKSFKDRMNKKGIGVDYDSFDETMVTQFVR
jgi:hypothetical protein